MSDGCKKGVCAHVKQQVKQQVRQVAVRVEMCTCEVLHLRKFRTGSTGWAAVWSGAGIFNCICLRHVVCDRGK